MKLKEIPASLWHSVRLSLKSSQGLLEESKPSVPVVVSMTVIPSRLPKLALVLRSLLDQSVRPERILVWLHQDMESQIPNGVQRLCGSLIQLHFTPLKCSHKKLIHTLEAHPDRVVVTCDDDFLYHRNWLEVLCADHKRYPKHVIAQHLRSIQRNEDGQLKPYKQWIYRSELNQNSDSFLAIGGKGVLYPVGALNLQFNNRDLFLSLAPKADDLWFKAMELLNNTPVKRCDRLVPEPIPIMGTQTFSLKKENVDQDLNGLQWQQLSDHFNLEV